MVDTSKAVANKNAWDFLTYIGPVDIVIMFLVLALVVLIFVQITKPTLKIGSNVLSFGTKKNGKRGKETSPHASCPYNADFGHIIAKTSEIVTKLCYINLIDRVERQISYVEEKLTVVKSTLLDNYSKLLKSKISDSGSITAHEDYITYHRLVESMLREDVKDFVKRSLSEDDWDNLSDTELKVYVNEKFEYLFQTASEFMDIWYVSSKMLVSREELRQSVYLLKSKFLDLCFDVYNRAIKTRQEQEKTKTALKQELDDFYTKIVGVRRN